MAQWFWINRNFLTKASVSCTLRLVFSALSWLFTLRQHLSFLYQKGEHEGWLVGKSTYCWAWWLSRREPPPASCPLILWCHPPPTHTKLWWQVMMRTLKYACEASRFTGNIEKYLDHLCMILWTVFREWTCREAAWVRMVFEHFSGSKVSQCRHPSGQKQLLPWWSCRYHLLIIGCGNPHSQEHHPQKHSSN